MVHLVSVLKLQYKGIEEIMLHNHNQYKRFEVQVQKPKSAAHDKISELFCDFSVYVYVMSPLTWLDMFCVQLILWWSSVIAQGDVAKKLVM